jgi:hypothetical protein
LPKREIFHKRFLLRGSANHENSFLVELKLISAPAQALRRNELSRLWGEES